MVNVLNNSVLHTYNDGASSSIFFNVSSEKDRRHYEEVASQIIALNRNIPCNVFMSKKDRSINFSFLYKAPTGCLTSAKMNIDFSLKPATAEEFDLSFSSLYQYITEVVGYSTSDYFRANNDMPHISDEKDFLYIRIKPNMLKMSGEDLLGNNTLVIDFIKIDDNE